MEIPYYEVMFDQGTTCDLTGRSRRSAVQYVCQPDGHGEIYEIKETLSCEYEVIVLTSLLCSHPVYGYVLICLLAMLFVVPHFGFLFVNKYIKMSISVVCERLLSVDSKQSQHNVIYLL